MNSTHPSQTQIDTLLSAAHEASKNAYAPYSHYHVGAALLFSNGNNIAASNIENVSYGLSLCAETVAIASAHSQGNMSDIIAIGLAGGAPNEAGKAILTDKAVTPCGRCRQMIKEVADMSGIDTHIYCLHRTGHIHYRLSDILPDAFGPDNLS